MNESEKVVEVKHLTKNYGNFKAVTDVNLHVYKGDVYGFLGPNGAGKSTSLRCILSLISPDTGQIRIFGKDIHKHRYEILSRVGCIIEKPDFYGYLSARRNLEIFGRISGKQIGTGKISEILDFVGLSDRGGDSVSGFSHGMKQRLGIAQALLHDPDLIILDEPTTGLDPQGMIDIRNLILHLSHDLGKTIILSSHILYEIELIANRMVIIDKGKTLAEGSVSELLNQNELLVRFHVSDAEKAIGLLTESRESKNPRLISKNELEIVTGRENIPEINKRLIENGIDVFGIQSRRQLEDFFLQLTSH
jgi:ABC-2 type transport system ATP-binding protein